MDKRWFYVDLVLMSFVLFMPFTSEVSVSGDAFEDDDDDSASWNRCPWIRNKLKNGRVKLRSGGRMAKFQCDPGYELAGKRFATCVRGQWNNPIPVCVSRGCFRPPDVANAHVTAMYRGAVLLYECLPGYTIHGGATVYCDGRHWSSETPTCAVATTDPHTSCDFEDPDLCGWSHDPTHDFDWKRNQFATPSGHVGTGPYDDHTFGAGKGGFYLYMEASSPRKVNDTARLFSPVFPQEDSGGCFVFWYHMYGVDTGGLRVYVKPESHVFGELSPTWVRSGDQGNQWYRGNVTVPRFSENFQITIEGIRGNGYVGDTAIDDVSLRNDNCENIGNSTDFTSESDAFSCRGRCREMNESYACGCNDNCVRTSTCCDDFMLICTKVIENEGTENPEEHMKPVTNMIPLTVTTSSGTTSKEITIDLVSRTTGSSVASSVTETSREVVETSPADSRKNVTIPFIPTTSNAIPTTVSSATAYPTTSTTTSTTSSETSTTPSTTSTTLSTTSTTHSTTSTIHSTTSTTHFPTSTIPSTTFTISSTTSTYPSTTSTTSHTVSTMPSTTSTTPSTTSTMPSTTSTTPSTTSTTPSTTSTAPSTTSTKPSTAPITSSTMIVTTTSPGSPTTTSFYIPPTTSSVITSVVPISSNVNASLPSNLATETSVSLTDETRRTYNLRPRYRSTTPIYSAKYSSVTTVSTNGHTSSVLTSKMTSPVSFRTTRTSFDKSTIKYSPAPKDDYPYLWRTNTAESVTPTSVKSARSTRRLITTPQYYQISSGTTIKLSPSFTRIVTESTEKPSAAKEPHTSKAASTASNDSQSTIIIVCVFLVATVFLPGGIVFYIRRWKTSKQSKLADDSEMRFLSENEVVEFQDSSVLDRINFNQPLI